MIRMKNSITIPTMSPITTPSVYIVGLSGVTVVTVVIDVAVKHQGN